MRFKKGDKVEVFSQKEVPSGSWRCAAIISGNGHNYTVKYDGSMGSYGGGVFDRVPRKAMRPCPPVAEVSGMWFSGDVVEVFHYFAWKKATVVQVSPNSQYLVRLHGSLPVLEVGGHDLRPILCWQDDEWFDIPKGSENYEDSKRNEHSSLKYNPSPGLINARTRQHLKDEYGAVGNVNYAKDSEAVLSRSLKRSFPFGHSTAESYARPCQRIRVNEKDSMRLRFVFAQQPPLPEEVDAVASSKKKMCENYIHSSLNHGITGFSEMILEREKTDGAVGCSHAIRLMSSDDSVASSVGSCDVLRNYPYEFPDSISRGPLEDSDRHSSNAESCFRLGSEDGNCSLPIEEMLTEEIHRLELKAYHRIIKVLHASGPLSWEQETLLTNLRYSLHISNEEHLMELRPAGGLCPASKCLKMILGPAIFPWC
ncbi:hypothetical protein Dimus_034410 [Dionaea muscipula]